MQARISTVYLGIGAIFAIVLLSAMRLPGSAAMVPIAVCVLGIVMAAVTFLVDRPAGSGHGSSHGEEEAGESPASPAMSRKAIALTCAYPLLIWIAGYILGSILFSTALVVWVGRRSWKVALGFGVLIVGLWWVFTALLRLRLPAGLPDLLGM